MTDQEQKELGKILWDIANELRGGMNADDFRDYMLVFLFLYYLSDNYRKAAQKLLNGDYPQAELRPLQFWYKNHEQDIADFEGAMRSRVHYVIKPEYLWDNIAELARTQSSDLLKTLEEGFKFIEEESFELEFKGLFSEINLHSEKLGKTASKCNEKLCDIITALNKGLKGFSKDDDALGDAYEYLISEFAANSGKKAGEFYTPQQISSILAKIVILDSQDPETGEKEKLGDVMDFACGSGSLLLNIYHRVTEKKHRIGKIYGQEKNVTTYNLARMNMLLHGVKDSEFEIFHGDTLLNEWPLLQENGPRRMEFEAIVANPPFSLRWKPTEETAQDPRFKNYGVAPKSAADFAFLLHGFHYLKDGGTMAIIMPHGVLFRGGAESRIREKLLKDSNIDAVIGLPANLFYSTGIPVCILVLKKCRKNDDVLFVNASSEEYYEKGKRQNRLRKNDVKHIVETYQFRKELERFSRRVPMGEIEENGFNLNISRYVSTAKPVEPIDLGKVHEELAAAQRKIEQATAEHNRFLQELGLPLIP